MENRLVETLPKLDISLEWYVVWIICYFISQGMDTFNYVGL